MRLPITIASAVLLLLWSLLVWIFVLLLWIIIVPLFWVLFIPFRLLAVPMRGGANKLRKQLLKNVNGWQGRMKGFFGYLLRLWTGLANWQTGRRWQASLQ
jgi:succinate-acetate transporter protein